MTYDRARMVDGEYYTVGDSDDGKWWHDGTDTYFVNDTGEIYFKSRSHGSNINISAETVAGVEKQMMKFDPDISTNGAVILPADNLVFSVGASSDLSLKHDGTDSWVVNSTGDLKIDNNAHGRNTVFTNEDAGGVDRTTLTLDPDNQTAVVMGICTGSTTVSADTDSLDVKGIGIVRVNTNGGSVVIGGFANGVSDQVVHILKQTSLNTLTLEHNEGTGTQPLILSAAVDKAFTSYGGMTLVCNGTNWFEIGY